MALESGAYAAGHDRVGGDAVIGPPLGRSDGQQHIAGLGLAVGRPLLVGAALEVDVIEDDRGEQVAARAERDDARATGGRERVVEAEGQVEVAEVVLVAAGGNPFAQSRERLDEAVGALLAATAATGLTRSEVEPDDVVVSLSGIAMVAGVLEDRDQLGRVLDLLYEGLRTRP